MATFNDTYISVPGPLTQTPLFLKLKLLTIFDIYKLQLGKLVYDSLNNIGPTRSIIQSQELPKYIVTQPAMRHKVISLEVGLEPLGLV